MAGSVSKTLLIGSLGADPERKSFGNGGSVVNLRLATSETWRDKSGDRQERTSWHAVVIRNEKLGEIAMQYCKKGSKIYVEGQIQYRDYEKDGQKHRVAEIVLAPFNGQLTLLDGRNSSSEESAPKDNGAGRSENTGRSQSEQKNTSTQKKSFSEDLDDEIPF